MVETRVQLYCRIVGVEFVLVHTRAPPYIFSFQVQYTLLLCAQFVLILFTL